MARGWISPWNGSLLSADELIDEVALAAISRLYILSELGYPDHQLKIESDSIVIRSPVIDYSFVIYFPTELYEMLSGYFPGCLLSLKREYGIDSESTGLEKPSGEKMGEMLRYFHSLARLIGLVSARRCWNKNKILAIHGVQPSVFLSKFESDLELASIRYLVLYPLGEEPGSCFFRTIRVDEADRVLRDINAGRTGVVEILFQLERDYGPHAMISNDRELVS